MKIAISSTDKKIESQVSDVFGRSPYFIIVEIADKRIKKTEVIKNENINQMTGVGISIAKLMAEKNVKAVIVKNVGPRAVDVLRQFKIKFYYGQGSVKEVLEQFIKGELQEIKKSRCQGCLQKEV